MFNPLHIDRGFHTMIPKPPEEVKDSKEFQHQIKFSLFGRTFSLSFNVIKQE